MRADPRLIPARPDLAAAHLRGQVAATAYAAGRAMSVIRPTLPLWRHPDRGAPLDSELLAGEGFTLYEERADGLAWGQAEDGYVGYVPQDGLAPAVAAVQTVHVSARCSHVYAAPSVKAPVLAVLPFRARLAVAGPAADGFRPLAGAAGHVPAAHLAPLPRDPAAVAAHLVGSPYLWGGRSAAGLDCSALVQLSFAAAGVALPRDSDLQMGTGQALDQDCPLARNDLIFWKGHVGLMADGVTLIHANAHHMAVAVEPLAEAVARIAATGGGPVIGRRRIPLD